MKLSIATVSLFLSLSGLVSATNSRCKKMPTKLDHILSQIKDPQEETRKLQEDVPSVILPEGIWTETGYGRVFAKPGIANVSGTFSWFEETQVSCILLEPVLTLEIVAAEIGLASALSGNDTVLILTDVLTGYQYLADKSDSYSAACVAGITPVPDDEDYVRDPAFTLTAMKQWFYEHYAFFDLRYEGGYDAWAQKADSYTLDADTTDEELLNAMAELVTPLDDSYIETEDAAVGGSEIPWFDELSMEFTDLQASNSSAWANESEYLEAQVQIWLNTLDTVYLD